MGEPFCVSEVFWYQKLFCVVGLSRFCQSFLSHNTEKFRRGTLVFFCFLNVLLLINFWITRYHDFVEFFCLLSPGIIVGETFCFSELLWYRNFWDNKGITNLSIVFVSRCAIFVGKPSMIQKIWAIQNFYA